MRQLMTARKILAVASERTSCLEVMGLDLINRELWPAVIATVGRF